MSGFSAALKLGDLDDYLTPVNDCVVLPASKPKASIIKKKDKISSAPAAEPSTSSSTVATISLSDCLACSGCVTSAETVLLQSHSVDQLVETVGKSKNTIFAVSISSASRRALSTHFRITPKSVVGFVEANLKNVLGSANVVCTDTSFSEAIVVAETMREFAARDSSSPFLTSHCPGWSCYATKVLGVDVVSLMSRVKSAEQIQALILKGLFTRAAPVKIHHIFVSPCFDKKLEVIRPDYTVAGERAVDLVLATTELVELLGRPSKPQPSPCNSYPFFRLICKVSGLMNSWAVDPIHSHSGGYAQAAAANGEWMVGKNKDLLSSGDILRSYGFRNIQNVTRRIKAIKSEFIEIMACPGGCPNGGGQPVQAKPIVNSTNNSTRIKEYYSWMKNIFSAAPPQVNPNELDLVCPPTEYTAAMRMRGTLMRRFGDHALYTEWKSVSAELIDPVTGEKIISSADLKW